MDGNVIRATERCHCVPQSEKWHRIRALRIKPCLFFLEKPFFISSPVREIPYTSQKTHISSVWDSWFVKKLMPFGRPHPSEIVWIQCRIPSQLLQTFGTSMFTFPASYFVLFHFVIMQYDKSSMTLGIAYICLKLLLLIQFFEEKLGPRQECLLVCWIRKMYLSTFICQLMISETIIPFSLNIVRFSTNFLTSNENRLNKLVIDICFSVISAS